MSITVDLCGGLGNQLFQIQTVFSLAKKFGLTPYFPNKYLLDQAGETDRRHTYYHLFSNIVLKDTRPADCIEISEKNGFTFQEIQLEAGKNYLLTGYFQSYRYIPTPEPLSLPLSDQKRIENLIPTNVPTVSLHVRHGDYLRLSHFHPILPIEYYRNALKLFGDIHVVIFSDDLPWCQANFDWIPKKQFIQETDYVELALMSRCDHNIIANSSFSWWGAFLNPNPNKKVIYPSRWIVYNVDISDMVPRNWVRIDV